MKKLYYFTGFITLLFLFPSLYISLIHKKELQQKYSIPISLYQEPDDGCTRCFSLIIYLQSFDLSMYSGKNNNLFSSKLHDIHEDFINKKINSDFLIIFPESITYKEFISMLEIPISEKPSYILKDNVLFVRGREKCLTYDELGFWEDGMTRRIKITSPKLTTLESIMLRFNGVIRQSKELYYTIKIYKNNLILFFLWFGIAIINISSLKRKLKDKT